MEALASVAYTFTLRVGPYSEAERAFVAYVQAVAEGKQWPWPVSRPHG